MKDAPHPLKDRRIKIRVTPEQDQLLRQGAALANPADPPGVSTWLRDLGLRDAQRLLRKSTPRR